MLIFRISLAFCLLFLVIVIELIRRKKLEERYSILWFAVGIIMLALSLSPNLLEFIADLTHVVYPPSLLFFLGFIFALIIILHLTTVISKMHRKMTRLIQEVALLRRDHEENRL